MATNNMRNDLLGAYTPSSQPGTFVKYLKKEEAVVERIINTGLGFLTYEITLLSNMKKLEATFLQLEKCSLNEDLSQEFSQEMDADVDINIVFDEDDIPDNKLAEEVSKLEHNDNNGRLENNSTKKLPKQSIQQANDSKPEDKQFPKKRFVKQSDEDLEKLASSRLAKGTKKVTKYGVRVFKGKFLFLNALYNN